jgi:hypothetical protein
MKLYRGNAHWLYQQLKKNYIDIYRNETGMLSYSDFKTKIENGSEFWFAGCSYKSSDEYSLTHTEQSKFKNDSFSI